MFVFHKIQAYNTTLLVLDSGRVIHKILQYFPGSIYLFGPVPRHLTPCCEQEAHVIKGPADEMINMCAYTSSFSSFLQGSPGIVRDRVTYISYHEIFGEVKDLKPDILSDGVHLSKAGQEQVAQFIISLMGDRPSRPTLPVTNLNFTEFLMHDGILSDPAAALQPSNLAEQFTGRCRVRTCSESSVVNKHSA